MEKSTPASPAPVEPPADQLPPKVEEESFAKVEAKSEVKVKENGEKPMRKTSEAQRRAISKYESNFKRINCRLSPEMWEKIRNTGESANTVIVKALTAYFG